MAAKKKPSPSRTLSRKAARKPAAAKSAVPKKGGAADSAAAVAGPAPGRKAPDFALPDETGRIVRPGDFRGRKLVIYFYPKDLTPGCTQESCDFRDNVNRLASSGAAVVGVSADSVESHRKFKDKHGLNFPLLSDPGKKVLRAYGVWQQKSLYGRSFMGIVRTTFILGPDGKVEKVFPKVKVQGHVDEVLAAL